MVNCQCPYCDVNSLGEHEKSCPFHLIMLEARYVELNSVGCVLGAERYMHRL